MDALVRYSALVGQAGQERNETDYGVRAVQRERRWKTFLTLLLSINVFLVSAAITLLAFFLHN